MNAKIFVFKDLPPVVQVRVIEAKRKCYEESLFPLPFDWSFEDSDRVVLCPKCSSLLDRGIVIDRVYEDRKEIIKVVCKDCGKVYKYISEGGNK